jgi:Flp pilus assembly protein TadG
MFDRALRQFAAKTRRQFRRSAVRRLVQREDGAVAIEFALVATPFFAIVFATLETALMFFAGQVLETAVADSSRLILTYQAQSQNFDAAAFKDKVCTATSGLFSCTGINVDVRTAASFGAVDLSKPLDANGNLQNNFVYQPGNPGDIVVVRVMYQWPLITQFSGFGMSDMAGGNKLLMATAVFRNEPK